MNTAPSPIPTSINDEITSAIARIKTSDVKARQLLAACEGESATARATLLLVWDHLFHRLTRDGLDEDNIKDITALVQKLYASTNQRRTVEIRERADARAEDDFRDRKERLRSTLHTNRQGLSEAVLAQVDALLDGMN